MRNILTSTTLALAFGGAVVAPTPAASAVLQPGFGGVRVVAGNFDDFEPVTVPAGPSGTFAGLDFDRDTGLRTGVVGNRTASERARGGVTVSRVDPPEVEALAAAQVQSRDLSGAARAMANAALVFEVLVSGTGRSILDGLIVDTVPLLARVQVSLTARVTSATGDDAFASAIAGGEVVASDRPITINDRAQLRFDPDRSWSYAEAVQANASGALFAELNPPGPIFVGLDAPVDGKLFIGKAVRTSAGAGVSFTGFSQAGSEAEAILDPVISFDQARFQSIYGADCAAAGLLLCPDMTELFALEFSPGLDNSLTTTPIPLPATVWLLAAGVGGLALSSRRCKTA